MIQLWLPMLYKAAMREKQMTLLQTCLSLAAYCLGVSQEDCSRERGEGVFQCCRHCEGSRWVLRKCRLVGLQALA